MVIPPSYWYGPPQYTSTVNEPNLLTGKGHGHYRPRGKRVAYYHKKKHNKVKMSKQSRRRNRA